MTITAAPSLAGLVDGLAAEGVLPEPWRAVFLAVPREVFIPEVIWRDAGEDLVPLHRCAQPAEWLHSAYEPAGLLSLTVGPDGTATGGLVNTTISFMPLRDQRIARPAVDVVRDTDTPKRGHTDVHPSDLCNGDDAPFAIAIQVPGCHREYQAATGDGGRWCVWFLEAGSRSWARFDRQPGADRWPVRQSGHAGSSTKSPRHL